MPFSAILNGEIEVGDPITQSLMQKIKDNFDYFSGIVGALDTLDIPDNSFEADADADGVPDNWTVTYHPGGSGALVTGIEGAKAWRFTAPSGVSNGGGYIDSDYIAIAPAGEGGNRWLSFLLKASTSGIGVKVTIRQYDSSKSYLASADIFSSTSVPTNPYRYLSFLGATQLGALTRYIRIRLEGGTVGPGVAGTVTFDTVSLRPQPPWAWSLDSNMGTDPVTTSATSFTTLTTTGVSQPGAWRIGNCKILVTAHLDAKSSGSYEASVRLNHSGSSSYSNVGLTLGTSYVGHCLQIMVDAAFEDSWSLNVQGMSSSGSGTTTITKPFARIFCEILAAYA